MGRGQTIVRCGKHPGGGQVDGQPLVELASALSGSQVCNHPVEQKHLIRALRSLERPLAGPGSGKGKRHGNQSARATNSTARGDAMFPPRSVVGFGIGLLLRLAADWMITRQVKKYSLDPDSNQGPCDYRTSTVTCSNQLSYQEICTEKWRWCFGVLVC